MNLKKRESELKFLIGHGHRRCRCLFLPSPRHRRCRCLVYFIPPRKRPNFLFQLLHGPCYLFGSFRGDEIYSTASHAIFLGELWSSLDLAVISHRLLWLTLKCRAGKITLLGRVHCSSRRKEGLDASLGTASCSCCLATLGTPSLRSTGLLEVIEGSFRDISVPIDASKQSYDISDDSCAM